MASKDLIDKLKRVLGDDVNYLPYNIANIAVSAGSPAFPIRGLQYIWARHNNPQTRMVMSLNGGGMFVKNNNMSGVIEIAVLGESYSSGNLQLMDFTGIPIPIFATDTTTAGTSFMIGSACRQTNTPTWRKDLFSGFNIFTFETPRLFMAHGVRLPEA